MADLTSTISIQGIINGQRVDWSSSATVADIVDAGTRFDGPTSIWGQVAFDGGNLASGFSPVFDQLSPTYIMAKNDASSMPTGCSMVLTGGGTLRVGLMVAAGGFVTLMDTNGVGITKYSATNTDTDTLGVINITNDFAAPGMVGTLAVLTGLKA